MDITALSNQILPSDTPLAQLLFVTDQANQSAVLAFGLSDVAAKRSTGQILENAAANGGRLFLVGTQPVLDAQNGNGQRQLILYAPPIHSYDIQFRTNVLAGADWTKFTTVLADSAAAVIIDSLALPPPLFYRAVQVATGPRFVVTQSGATSILIFFGEVGKTYHLQSQDQLGAPVWNDEKTITLTSPTLTLDGLIHNSGTRFYRITTDQ